MQARENATLTRPVWILPEPLEPGLPRFHDDGLLHAILARRLDDRAAAIDFLDSRARPAPDPFLLPGLGEAVERLIAAIRHNEPIGIFGDYDTDGVTSSALLALALRAASGGVQPAQVRLPLRSEGYGLSEAGVDDLAAAGVKLLIAVDCGSKDHAAVTRARQRGIDVVIVDHHRITEAPPEGAILASAQTCPNAPYRALSAAGLAYLLATALAHRGFDAGDGPGREPASLLDLAMIGLIGDVSTLTGVNRALVRDGLRRLRARPRPGLAALAEIAGLPLRTATSTDVAFLISPRLNAPGRLYDPRPAYELLVAETARAARPHAEATERANHQRRVLQSRVLHEIDEMIALQPALLERRVLIFAGQGWEPGIVGLAASKLVDKLDRPVIVMAVDDGVAHGSARSVHGFDITSALTRCANLLLRHGGHERAAGLAAPVEHLESLSDHLHAAMESSEALPPGPPRLEIDADLAPERLRLDTARLLQTLGPFGEGNAAPRLRIPGSQLRDYTIMGRERQHLKLHLGEGGNAAEAILWSGAARSRELVGVRHVDVVGSLEINEWQGAARVQVRVEDFRSPE